MTPKEPLEREDSIAAVRSVMEQTGMSLKDAHAFVKDEAEKKGRPPSETDASRYKKGNA
ncbi:MAG: hypothetical protein LBD12_07215 [Clostridiales Family XIII bacterium]|jgi:hypothetical protein|nr:hypothetical protein [Clostridiales Family XIII bacterium]